MHHPSSSSSLQLNVPSVGHEEEEEKGKPLIIPLYFTTSRSTNNNTLCGGEEEEENAIFNDDDNDNNDEVQEWAMIEVNGELLRPNDVSVVDGEEETILGGGDHEEMNHTVTRPLSSHQIELGSLWFDEVSAVSPFVFGRVLFGGGGLRSIYMCIYK